MLAEIVNLQAQLSVPEFAVTHLLPYLLTIPLCGQWNDQRSEPEYWLCFSVGYYSTCLWIRMSFLSCVTNFAFPIGGGGGSTKGHFGSECALFLTSQSRLDPSKSESHSDHNRPLNQPFSKYKVCALVRPSNDWLWCFSRIIARLPEIAFARASWLAR